MVFIMATTEIERVPETIVSRAQRFDFGRYGETEIVGLLQRVCASEGIAAEERAIELVARAAGGGMRDALTLLEQYSVDGTLTTERVEASLSIVSVERLDSLIAALDSLDTAGVEEFVAFVAGRSFAPRRVLEQLLEHLRVRMRTADSGGIARLSRYFGQIFRAYERCKSLVDPLVILSAGLYACMAGDVQAASPAPAAPARPVATPAREPRTPEPRVQPAPPAPRPTTAEPPSPALSLDLGPDEPQAMSESPPAATGKFDFRVMTDAIKAMPKRAFVAMSLKASRYEYRDGELRIMAPNAFHLGKLDSPDALGCIRLACQQSFGQVPEISVSLDGAPRKNLADAAEEVF